ncbi:response regulator [Pseudonocardia endophytica]|uniref:Two-component system nitrate/nitrite response regulator NarL n=1 Tax=Pseudonocardia endophytica TaxID=401976 RepID=A0A4R1I2T3_PSEEN|nr:response regulator transcription factor [Pseudonocardia endophytica]TCK26819.1 two-component system nitrate/nitrite response regulator NarL [Pseudonocardia endophytica]
MSTPHTVLVVDDHPVVLDGVRALVETAADLTVVGEATDRATAISRAALLRPDAVVLDLRMQGSHAPETAARIKSAAPGARVLLHTATEELEPVRAALGAGADGAVFKDSRLLVEGLRAVLTGQVPFVDPRLAAGRRSDDPRSAQQVLSPREYELLVAFADGKSTRDIAGDLYLTESTVRSYVKSLLTKLGVHSRIEAVAEARRLTLI